MDDTTPQQPQGTPGGFQPSSSPSDGAKKKSSLAPLIAIVVLILLVVVGYAAWAYLKGPQGTPQQQPPTQQNGEQPPQAKNDVQALDQELQNLNLGNVEADFQDVDQDLNNL
ncbi:hypothetical protein D6833_13530 [Candidatus Parcubacteria bacterium]|nr:MAG: hypothetical protein D6833_13530 [Candidatus Parcubacteria bacterium]